MDKTIIIGNKEFKIKINFKKSYELTKFRNKLSYGIDFDDADKKIIEEIAKIQLQASQGQDIDMSLLSPETIKYLSKKSSQRDEVFTYDELIEIGKILTEIENNEEIEELYNIEVEENGYDELLAKLTLGISTVFLNAKDTSNQKTEAKQMRGIKVA